MGTPQPAPVQVLPSASPQPAAAPRHRKSVARRIFTVLAGLIFLLSVVLNLYLLAIVAAQMEQGLEQVTVRAGQEDQTVAVYRIEGIIDRTASETFAAFADEVVRDGDIKAVLLRVETPGGTVSDSDRIHAHVKRMRDAGKKVVVSMGGVAASGGYYVSAPADEIFAEPTTITGSIGVLMSWLVLEGTLEHIGVEPVTLKSRRAEEWKDEISPFRLPNERQKEHLLSLLDEIQARFEQVVRDGRGGRLNPRVVSETDTEPFDGKVYLAEEAKRLGLIDSIGYQSEAVDRLARLAGLWDPNVVRYQRRKGVFERLIGVESPPALGINAETLDSLQTPRVLLMWKAQ